MKTLIANYRAQPLHEQVLQAVYVLIVIALCIIIPLDESGRMPEPKESRDLVTALSPAAQPQQQATRPAGELR